MSGLDLRFRLASAELVDLPWLLPLGEWDATTAALRDVPVGPSRHLVRFIDAGGALWALKELPRRLAVREYDVLREMENMSLNAVRAAGLVVQPFDDTAILVTRYLEGSWQYRRLLMRVPTTDTAQRRRLLWAIAGLLVDLHRNGIYWGDCSLANTLFVRDGQMIQAWMVDAETAEVRPGLSDGQRNLDLDIMFENVVGGLLDVATKVDEAADVFDQVVDEAQGIVDRYRAVWSVLHERPMIERGDRVQMADQLRRLNDLGFAVDEVHLESAGEDGRLRLRVDVAGRRFHAEQLRSSTGLEVGQGQARILLDDLRRSGRGPRGWLDEVFRPGSRSAHQAVGHHGSAVQAYCDMVEVRTLLSEQSGQDVGDEAALQALTLRSMPADAAATLGFVDEVTQEVPVVPTDGEHPSEPRRVVD